MGMSKAPVKADDLPAELLQDIRALIEAVRRQTAAAVNVGLTLLYWRMGQRIHTEILGDERATYGEQIVATLSRQLVAAYGRGFAEKNLRRMMQFALAYPDEKIVVTLLRQLNWSHFLALLPLDKPLQRDFYAEMCRIERWSVRTLRERIDSMLYERTALSKKPDELIEQELAALRTTGDLSLPFVLKASYVSPTMALVGGFEVDRVIETTPTALWSKVKKSAGLTKDEFSDYYNGSSNAFGIFIKKSWYFETPLALQCLRKKLVGFHPPQSYRYVSMQEACLLGIL